MDFATIVSAISSVGFPIIFCIILYKQIIDQGKEHKEEVTEMTKAISNNTLAIQHLSDLLSTKELKND